MRSLRLSVKGPCLFFEDFNEIICSNEKFGGECRGDSEMSAFRDCISDSCLRDLGYLRSTFTCRRVKTHTNLNLERLDRFLASADWCELFPSYSVVHLPIYRSDHCHMMITSDHSFSDRVGAKFFKFESYWLSREDCREVVYEAWNSRVGEDLDVKIDHCAKRLRSWASKHFEDILKKIRTTEKKLAKAQCCVPDTNMVNTCKVLLEELDNLHRLEDSYWFMRARANEKKDGDKSTKYFHHKASSRRRRNYIK